MATFTGTGSHNSNYTGTLTVTEQSYSVADNTSVVAYSLVLTGNSGYYFQQWYLTTKVTINGTEVQNRYEQISMPSPSGGVSTYAVCSGTLTVPHNNDGTKTIAVSASMSTVTSQSFLPGTINMSGSLALTTIPRASTMTVPSFTIGSAGTMTISMASSSFSHTITYSFSGLTGTAASVNAGVSSASWTPPTTFYAKLPNSTSGTVSLVLNTYSGSTLVGSKSYTATVSVGSSIKPTVPSITLSPVNTNTWLNSKGLYVAGYTKIRVRSSATAGSGASISSYTISGAFSGTGSDVTSSVISSSGTKSVTVTVTDSRGRTNSASSSVSFLAYSYPSLTTFTAVRGTYSGGTWTSDANGDHVRVQAVGTVSLSANGNTGTKTVKIGSTNPSATSGNYYYFTGTNATTSYTVTGTITDSLGNSTTRTLTVSTVEVPFNVDVDLPGVGVGMIAQSSKTFEVASDWTVKLPLHTTQQISSYDALNDPYFWNSGITTRTEAIFYRIGYIVQCYIRFNSPASAVSSQVIATIPTGYRPLHGVVVNATKLWYEGATAPIQISTGGAINFVNLAYATNTGYIICASWLTSNAFPS